MPRGPWPQNPKGASKDGRRLRTRTRRWERSHGRGCLHINISSRVIRGTRWRAAGGVYPSSALPDVHYAAPNIDTERHAWLGSQTKVRGADDEAIERATGAQPRAAG